MSPAASALTIATWNVAGGRDPDGVPFDVVGRCAALDADVLVLQETVTPHADLADAVAERLGYGFRLRAGEPGARAWVEVLSRVPMTERPAIRITPAPGWCGARWAARAVVDQADLHLALTAVHLCHRPDAALRQLRSLRRHLDADPAPAVLVGDCNLWRAGVTRVLRGWDAPVRGATWPADRPRHQIDHVLVRGLRAVDAVVVDLGGSDHRAVRATLVPTARATTGPGRRSGEKRP